MCAQLLGCVWLFGNPMKCNPPASLSMEFSRQEDQSGLSFSTPEDLPDPKIKPTSLVSPAFVGGLEMLGNSSLHLLAMRTSTQDVNFSASSFLFQFQNHDITMYTHIWWDTYGRIHRYLYRYAWSRKWQLTPGFLPGKSRGQRSLAGYSPWDHRVRQDLVTKPPPPYRYACIYVFIMSFPGGASGEEPACQCRRCERCGFDPWIRKIPWRRAWPPTPICLPGESPWTEEVVRVYFSWKFLGQRSLVGYSPKCCKESDTAEEA